MMLIVIYDVWLFVVGVYDLGEIGVDVWGVKGEVDGVFAIG